jgi:hypothetical protein
MRSLSDIRKRGLGRQAQRLARAGAAWRQGTSVDPDSEEWPLRCTLEDGTSHEITTGYLAGEQHARRGDAGLFEDAPRTTLSVERAEFLSLFDCDPPLGAEITHGLPGEDRTRTYRIESWRASPNGAEYQCELIRET